MEFGLWHWNEGDLRLGRFICKRSFRSPRGLNGPSPPANRLLRV